MRLRLLFVQGILKLSYLPFGFHYGNPILRHFLPDLLSCCSSCLRLQKPALEARLFFVCLTGSALHPAVVMCNKPRLAATCTCLGRGTNACG